MAVVSAGVAVVATGVSVSSAAALEPVVDSVVEVLYSDEALASADALLVTDWEVSADEADEVLASVDSMADAADDAVAEASAAVEALEPVDEVALLVVVVVELEVPLPPARGTQSSVEIRQREYPDFPATSTEK